MQIGVMGVGRMGRFDARCLSGLSDVDRFVLADANDQRAVKLDGDLESESASFPEMVEDVDGVIISASTSAHPELTMHCVDAGKPSFCEKPTSLDLASSDRVVHHVRAAQGQVQMGFQHGFDPGHRAAHDLVESGGLSGWCQTPDSAKRATTERKNMLVRGLRLRDSQWDFAKDTSQFAKNERENSCTVEDAQETLRVAVACDLSRAKVKPVAVSEMT